MTPLDWMAALRPERTAKECNQIVGNYVRTWLQNGGALAHGSEMLSTGALVEALWPVRFVKNDAHKAARDRIFKALNPRVLDHIGLGDCVTEGPSVTRYGKTIRPLLWHAPIEQIEMVELRKDDLATLTRVIDEEWPDYESLSLEEANAMLRAKAVLKGVDYDL